MHTPGESPFIKLDDVTLRVTDRLLFAHTDWEIASDQHWAIIGPNGSGKSTLANAVFRQVPVVQGRILYFFERDGNGANRAHAFFNRGEVIRISAGDQRNLIRRPGGYHQARWNSIGGADMPTVSELLTGKSIEHLSRYQVDPTRVSEAVYRKRRRQAIDLLGIDYLLDRKILHVSNGEARKVLLARSLMQSPKLLILDDPFSGLDTASRDILASAIDSLLAAGNPRILFVASRLDEIPAGITHLLCVDDNRVVDRGKKDAILRTAFARETFAPTEDAASAPSHRLPTSPRQTGEKHSALIEMVDTAVSYDGTDVLRNIDWTVRPGENWAVLGPNGAGKTTLLSLILADNPQAYANSIALFGRRRGSGESIWDIKLKIGWVSPELQAHYRGETACYDAVCSGFFDSVGLYRKCSPDQARTAGRWMRSFGIADLADRPFGTVSVGQQRLVLLARALVKDPALLILDEPCQGMDAENRTRIIGLLDRICSQMPVSLIYVTHHAAEMPGVITHVLKLEGGRIREIGRRGQVLGG